MPLEVGRCTTKFYHLAHMRRRRSPVLMKFTSHMNSSICIRTLKKVYSSLWELKELTESCQLLKKGSESALEVRRCTTKFYHLAHMRRRRSPVPMQVYIPVNSSICIRTLKKQCIHRVRAERVVTESCQLLKKGSESALEVRRCTTKFYHSCTHAQKEITCSNASLHRSEQFTVRIRTLKKVYSSCESWKS